MSDPIQSPHPCTWRRYRLRLLAGHRLGFRLTPGQSLVGHDFGLGDCQPGTPRLTGKSGQPDSWDHYRLRYGLLDLPLDRKPACLADGCHVRDRGIGV